MNSVSSLTIIFFKPKTNERGGANEKYFSSALIVFVSGNEVQQK